MSEQYSFCSNEVDSGVADDFILKLSSSDDSGSDDDLRLEISSDEDDVNSGYCNSWKEVENQSSTSLDYKLQLSYNKVEVYLAKELFSNSVNTNEENNSSSESELELNRFKKIVHQPDEELFRPDSCSILSQEESLMDNSKDSYPELTESYEIERRITRSDALKRKKLLQKEALTIFKERRSEKIKILMPFVSACVTSSTPTRKFLRQKLRQMKLFKIL